ncbi:MAG: acyl-CoA dehydrogenase family protein [Burkholderiaceae bacterium]|nr:acyl-CoA dehydrogenase family protein [Burkholderiaceae bacterium]
MDALFSDAVRQLLTDACSPAVVRAIEAGASSATLWQALEDAGFCDALVPEAAGGAGLSLAEVYPILELCGHHAVPVPLGETLLARGLIANAGVAVPQGSIVFGEGRLQADGGLRCAQVRCGAQADAVLVALQGETRLLPAAPAHRDIAGFCLDVHMVWPAGAWDSALPVPGTHDLHTLQAALYAAQLAGALMAVFSRTLQYANERQQFGKPIGKFQAIQHQLSVVSEHAFAARMAAMLGLRADGLVPDRLRVAMAKARTSEAALEVAGLSHSIHGAIGFTVEFDLQLFTRRLHAWRQAAGSESYWHDVMGRAVLDRPDGLSLDLVRTLTDTPA